MVRRLAVLLVAAGLALAQEEESGISEDERSTAEPEKAAEPGKPAGQPRTTAYPARTPGKKVATVVVKKKVYSLALPADWVLEAFDDPKSELAWEVLLPGSSKRANLWVMREETHDARSLPYYRAEWLRQNQTDAKVEVLTKPMPRVVVRRTGDDGERVTAFASVSVRNNKFSLQLQCSSDDFAQADADLIAAARTFTAEVELWPPIPKGYEVSAEGTWLVARAPEVTASIGPLVKALKGMEKRFRRDHGPLPKTEPPIVVLVLASKAGIEKIEPKAAEGQNDHFVDWGHRRLLAVPIAKDNKDQEGMLSFAACSLLYLAKYGDVRPDWVRVGECTAAQAEVYCDKPLPSLDAGYVAWLSSLTLVTLDEMDKLREGNPESEAWFRGCLFYVAALREGKYRKQYRAFLDEYAETGDALGALARHLGTIDQAELRDSTNKFTTTRIKEEKREHENH